MDVIYINCYGDKIETFPTPIKKIFTKKVGDILAQVDGDTITVTGDNLVLKTATGGKILVKDSDDKEIVVGIGYSFVKNVVQNGTEVWSNNSEK
ncbi:MAG: hypothetical protein PHN31_04870 [Candidatus Gracilibacteria bacterium]|nr:hypothetical protein [Candidatus Gracilibacteria bacterium]